MRDEGDGARGRGDEPDREQRDRPQVRAQVAQPGEERRGIEERRQDRDEHEVRGQLHLGQPWHETEQQTAGDEEDGDGQPPAGRHREHRGDGRQQYEQLELAVGGEVHRPRR